MLPKRSPLVFPHFGVLMKSVMLLRKWLLVFQLSGVPILLSVTKRSPLQSQLFGVLMLSVTVGPIPFSKSTLLTFLKTHPRSSPSSGVLISSVAVCRTYLSKVTFIDPYRPAKSTQPDLPEFIDTKACLCGLLFSQSTLPSMGYNAEMWRCIGDENSDISSGGNGKWYNTSLPSQDLSGINEPRNWGQNPPNASMAYVLVFKDGGALYEIADSENASALFGNDTLCTGVNDTLASTSWYATQ